MLYISIANIYQIFADRTAFLEATKRGAAFIIQGAYSASIRSISL